MDKNCSLHSFVNIKERKSILLDGIANVERFDEESLCLCSNIGKITVEGSGLKIVSLEKESGIIEINGRIDGIYYEREKLNGSLFKKLFK